MRIMTEIRLNSAEAPEDIFSTEVFSEFDSHKYYDYGYNKTGNILDSSVTEGMRNDPVFVRQDEIRSGVTTEEPASERLFRASAAIDTEPVIEAAINFKQQRSNIEKYTDSAAKYSVSASHSGRGEIVTVFNKFF